ncbi:extracellular solute-binding protein [Pseudemcibacter aquimaris]|uniref:extracellular solute-binding protein n=1 Tax=Pseudemcibacter aquimaris TaxID=2857064 RepID=UPI002011304B|nr:extracellular solute-binding protein [Pseudemcibacter aquimaris]MCC3861138.1 extracellular solute-binding protein [Pseudemcibacter aquimaris]WDU59955.1 extracellular solute-binding protein [Pseudemcibacter aquimaris]
MKRVFITIIAVFCSQLAHAVDIEYWQYSYKARLDAMDKLIDAFEVENPDINVIHTNFPYSQYRTKVAAAVAAGEGPDVVQLYYGWLDDYLKGEILQPLSKENFPNDMIRREFFPMVDTMMVKGDYYALPTAVRSLGLFWNKKIFREAGLDPSTPPQTLDELVQFAKRLTKYDRAGNIIQVGLTIGPINQDHNWWREVLVRQFGGTPYNDDNTKVTYTSDAGLKAFQFYTEFVSKHNTSVVDFMDKGEIAFKAGRAAMHIDGSFALALFNRTRRLEWGVAELPSHNGIKSNFSSYWVNGITSKASGEKRIAAEKFLKFITSDKAMQLWLDEVGELPARKLVAQRQENLNHPEYGPFIRGLGYAYSTRFYSESAQRKTVVDMLDRIVLTGMSVQDSLEIAAREDQAIIDKAVMNE